MRATPATALFTASLAAVACGTGGDHRQLGPDSFDGGAPPDGAIDPGLGDSGGSIFVDGDQPVKPPIGNRAFSQGNVPADADRLFKAATPASGLGPALIYPAAETMFPPNVAHILFQWKVASGSVFHLRFETSKGVLDIYTDGQHETCAKAETGASCWESAADTLLPYLDAAAGSTMKLQIEALDPNAPDKLWQSPSYSLHIGPKRVGGAIYYWSTTAQGVRRGTLDGRPPANYLTPSQAKGQCVACHTLSRSGKRLSVAFPGDLLGLVDVVETVPPPVTFGPASQGFPGQNIAASWATFSPDDSKLAVAGQGLLTVRNARTAEVIAGPLELPAGTTGSMPDWAPDGKHLVFAASIDAPIDRLARHLQGSSIAWLTADGMGFAGFESIAKSRGIVATCVGKESYANPMFSPDSRWLAFSRGDCESEGDPSSEIILAPAQPNAPQNHLPLANTQVGPQRVTRLQNGMPTWAPTGDGTIAWVAFTSTRDYGAVLTEGSKVGARVRQLWVAAIDLSKASSGDPSYPAFRLPAQDLTENNHRPFWTVDVLPPDWKPPDIK